MAIRYLKVWTIRNDGNIGYLDDISDIIPGVSIDLDN